jgi:hypothetical protein
MWHEIVNNLPNFSSTVLNGTDKDGYPYSVRCQPIVGRGKEVLRLNLSEKTALQAGLASLLCHSHNEMMWDLKAFLVRGELVQDEQGWIFKPTKFIPGGGVGPPMGQLKTMVGMRRSAKRYLEKRGLLRPAIPWADYKALRKESKQVV